MPVTRDTPAPYAPTKAILEIIGRHRARGLPPIVDADVLARSGIPDSLIPRTLQALQTLDLIDESGNHSDTLEGLRLAPEAEYQARMAEWLNAAYADVLSFVDPATDDETQIRDAFRPFKPTGQQSRMVSLFLGLYQAAGVAPERQASRAKNASGRTASASSPRIPKRQTTRHEHVTRNPPAGDGLPAPVVGLLSSLPKEGQGWTQEKRDKFVTTFSAVLDFCFPIMEERTDIAENDLDEDDLE